MFKRILQYFRPYLFRIIAAIFFVIIVAATTGASAYLVEPLLDDIFINKDASMLQLIPLLIILIFFLKGVAEYMNAFIMRTLGQEIIMNIRNELYENYLKLSAGFFADNSTGNLMSRITNDVFMMQQALPATVSIFKQSITVLGLMAVAFYRDPILAFIACFVFPLSIWPAIRISKKIRKFSKRGQEKMGDLSSILQETFTGIRIVKAFVMEEYEKKRFNDENFKFYKIFKKIIKVDAITSPLMELIGSVGVAAVIFYGGSLVVKGESTPGTFFSFLTALLMMYQPIKKISKNNNAIQQALAAASRVFEIIDKDPEIVEKKDATSELTFNGSVEFNNVQFSYAKDGNVLDGISFSVNKGKVIAFVGSSGAGKTTLVNLLPRFYDVTGGSITIDGVNIKDVTLNALRQQIGMVTQDTFLFNDTIKNNIAYGRTEIDESKIIEAARAANAHEFIMGFEDGYDTVIGERGVKISGGQRQRLAIARAIWKNPPILILDEATSALDTESEYLVQQALMNLIKDRTTFVIAHRLSTIQNADMIYVLDAGKIVESGKHDELLENSQVYKKLYNMQFKQAKE
ncbi:lipid A export permease/ATP-binding protein MsbA [Thermodesulfobacteriota bacterium]